MMFDIFAPDSINPPRRGFDARAKQEKIKEMDGLVHLFSQRRNISYCKASQIKTLPSSAGAIVIVSDCGSFV